MDIFSYEDVKEILNPSHDQRIKDALEAVNLKWLDWAVSEISAGFGELSPEDPVLVVQYLRVLNVVNSFYKNFEGKCILRPMFMCIVERAFTCFGENGNKYGCNAYDIARQRKYIRFFGYTKYRDIGLRKYEPRMELSFKGTVYMRSNIDSFFPLPVINSMPSVDMKSPSSKKAKQRVSIHFLETMYKAVINTIGSREIDAKGLYEEMRRISKRLPMFSNPSDMSHAKADLQKPPYNLKFIPRKYRLTQECIDGITTPES